MSPRERVRARRSVAIWWEAVSGGAFYNRWSAILSFLLATFVGVPTIEDGYAEGYLMAVVVAACGWAVLAMLILPAAYAERHVRSRSARGIIVLAVLLVAAGIRGPLNDTISVVIWGVGSAGDFGPRAMTNILSAVTMFSLVAVALAQYARRRTIASRLEAAVEPMRARLASAQQQAGLTRQMLAEAVERLRTSREAMLAGPVDFESVRAYADDVRAESHRFEARADKADAAVPASVPTGKSAVAHRSFSERLVATPWLVVGLIYSAASLPFSLSVGGPIVGLGGAVGVCLIDLGTGVLERRALPPRGSPARPALYLGVWFAAGAAVAALSLALLPQIHVIGLVGIIAIPGLALIVSLCVDALQVARAAAESSERVLARAARYAAEETARVSDPLRQAVSLLHGRVQGRCVILAAHADEHPPTAEQLAEFRTQTDQAFALMLGPLSDLEVERGSLGGALGQVERIVAAWRSVMVITLHSSPDADRALGQRTLSAQAADVVNEALVNAVKHSGAREAQVSLDLAPDGRLHVRVASPGTLSDSARRRSGIGTRRPGVRLTQSGDDVVLDAFLTPSATVDDR